jgi:hypothetical protein
MPLRQKYRRVAFAQARVDILPRREWDRNKIRGAIEVRGKRMSVRRHLVTATVVLTALAIAASVNAAPANVGLLSLTVCKPSKATKKKPRIVSVRWKTAAEPDLLGFNVYREVGKKRTKLNKALIGSKGAVAGASYKWLDRLPKTLKASPCYRLEAVSGTGTKTPLKTTCRKISCANPGV